MGDRATIKLNFNEFGSGKPLPPIYLYSHWGATDMPLTLAAVLSRQDRWDDDSYLARMIASAIFVDAGIGESTGAGLSPYPIETVCWSFDLNAKTITSEGNYTRYNDNDEETVLFREGQTMTYAEFISAVASFEEIGLL